MAVSRYGFVLVFTLFFRIGMHFLSSNTGGIGLELPFNNVAWIFVAVLIAMGLWQVRNSGRLLYSKYSLVLLLVFFALLIPFLYGNAQNPENVIERTLGLLAGLAVLFSIKQFELQSRDWLLIVASIVFAGVVESIFAWVQFWQPLQQYWSFRLTKVPFGVFQQPNVMASFCVTAIACSYYLLDRCEHYFEQKEIIKSRYGALLCVALAGFIVVVLQSRTGWMSLVFVMTIILLYGFKADSKETQLWKRYWFYVLSLSILFGVISLSYGEGARRSFEMVEQLGQIRRDTWHICWMMIKDSPWLGYGYGDFQRAFLEYQAQYFQKSGIYSVGNHRYPHNELVYWVVEGGVLPLLALLAGVLYGVRSLFLREGARAWLVIALLAPVVIHSLLEYPFYQSVAHWLIFIVLLSYTDNSASSYSARSPLKIFPGVVAILLVLLTTSYMAATMQARYWILAFLWDKNRDLRILTKVYVPAGMIELYTAETMIVRVYRAMVTGNDAEIKAFIDWVPARLQRYPNRAFYLAWVRAHHALGEEQEAEQVLIRSRVLYPKEKRFFDDKIYDFQNAFSFATLPKPSSISSEVVDKNNENQSGDNITQQKTPEVVL